MLKIDLHTHSVQSRDGGLKEKHYREVLEEGKLDFVAVTDHNSIKKAKELHGVFGDHIIIGEEIMTMEGEIVGLFLDKVVPPGLSLKESIEFIHLQGGLVYVPHPLERIRKGLSMDSLESIKDQIDIVEIYNGRSVRRKNSRLVAMWAENNNIAVAASSDAHGRVGWGRTYSLVDVFPTRDNLKKLLLSAERRHGFVGIRGILYPKFNQIRYRKGSKKKSKKQTRS